MADTDEKSSLFRTLLNKIPANMRFFASDLLGGDSLATNENFTEEQLGIMKTTAANAIKGEKGAYNKLRKVGTYFGSPEGEGSPIELNLGQLNV